MPKLFLCDGDDDNDDEHGNEDINTFIFQIVLCNLHSSLTYIIWICSWK